MRKLLSLIRTALKYYFYDAKNFICHSMILDYKKTQQRFLGKITLHAHVVEKGLTMPDMKPNFGKDNLFYLIDLCFEYDKYKYDINHILFVSAVSVVFEYKIVHEHLGLIVDADTLNKIEMLYKNFSFIKPASQPSVTKEVFFANSRANFFDFAFSRHSVRCFDGVVDMNKLKLAIELAQTAPSACNRQPNRVHVVSKGSKLFDDILSIQQGNRGFGFLADKLLIVSVDISSYCIIRERMGMFVDGGIYVMNLLYSLHYYNIAACTLNWFYEPIADNKIKSLLGIESEQVVAILAIGDLPQEFKYAKSDRLDISKVLTIH